MGAKILWLIHSWPEEGCPIGNELEYDIFSPESRRIKLNISSDKPNPSLVYNLYTDGMRAQIIRIALLLDVFTPLAEAPKDAHSMATLCGCDEKGMSYLLDYLGALDVLDKNEENYSLTKTAATFLVPNNPSYTGDWLLFQTSPEIWAGILSVLRGGQREFPPTPWAQDAWLESHSEARISASLEMWEAAGFRSGECHRIDILDLACGSAIKSFALAQADECVHVTCIDLDDVLDVTRDLAMRMDLLERVTFQPGDIHNIVLGTELYGAVLLGQISYFLTTEQNLDLFMRIHQTLVRGGVLVLDAAMAPEKPDDLFSMTSLMMWAWFGGAAHPFEAYDVLLKQVGFRTVNKHSDWWLTASR
jgi:SAM-dependent methyltransferase